MPAVRGLACTAGTLVEWCIIEGLGHEYSGHLRPGNAGTATKPDFGYQAVDVSWKQGIPPTGIPGTPILPGEANVDGYRYMMNRFSTLR